MAVTCKPQQNPIYSRNNIQPLGNFAWSPPPAQNLVAGTPFSLLLGAPTGGIGPYTFITTRLPAGLNINGGLISGTPTAGGLVDHVTIVAEDSSTPPNTVTATIIFTVAVPSITNAQAGAAMVGIASIPAALTGIAMNANPTAAAVGATAQTPGIVAGLGDLPVHPTVAAVGVASPQSVATGPSSFAPTLTGKGGVESETASGLAGTVLNANPTLGDCVALFIITFGANANDVASVTSPMGTFTKVSGAAGTNGTTAGEWWVCQTVTGLSQEVFVTTKDGVAWTAQGTDWSGGISGFVSGGEANDNVANPHLSVSPGAAGNVVLVGLASTAAPTAGPTNPWSDYDSGEFAWVNDADVAWQVTTTTAAVNAVWTVPAGENWLAVGLVLAATVPPGRVYPGVAGVGAVAPAPIAAASGANINAHPGVAAVAATAQVPSPTSISNPNGWMIPAYAYPTVNIWSTLAATAPVGTPSYVICDISGTGPGTTVDPVYTAAIANAQAKGWTVLGYVDTAYGVDTPAAVKTQIDYWYSLYGIINIFFDECEPSAGSVAYYQGLTAYVRTTHGAGLSFLNFGTAPNAGFLSHTICDGLGPFENTYAQWNSAPPANYSGYGIEIFMLVTGCTSAHMATVLSGMKALGANLFYITDETDGLYNVLPTYFTTENTAI
jgi:hypothetical protein